MTNSTITYLNEINRRYRYRATWAPHITMRLGDVGRFQNKEWLYIGNLSDKEFGSIKLLGEKEEKAINYDFKSSGGYEVKTKAKGETSEVFKKIGKLDAGFVLEFHKENSVVFKAKEITSHILKNRLLIKEKVLELWKNKGWDRSYFIIAEVIEAATATIIITNEGGAKAEIKVNGNIAVGTLDLVNTSLGLKLVDKNNKIEAAIIAESSTTPLYKVIRIKRGLFGGGKLSYKGIEDREDIFEEVPFGEE